MSIIHCKIRFINLAMQIVILAQFKNQSLYDHACLAMIAQKKNV